MIKHSTPYSLAMGHNILVNSMHMLKAFAIIVNGGYDVRPTIVNKISRRNQQGQEEIIFQNHFEKGKQLLSENASKRLREAMKYTTKIGGTAPSGDIYGYSEGGKSGTSEKIVDGQYSKDLYISSFIGFTPANAPQLLIMVVIDEPEKRFIPGKGKSWHGGVCAPPVFREIGKRTLEYLGIAPDDPFGYPYGDPRRDLSQADWQNELKSLKELYQQWNGK